MNDDLLLDGDFESFPMEPIPLVDAIVSSRKNAWQALSSSSDHSHHYSSHFDVSIEPTPLAPRENLQIVHSYYFPEQSLLQHSQSLIELFSASPKEASTAENDSLPDIDEDDDDIFLEISSSCEWNVDSPSDTATDPSAPTAAALDAAATAGVLSTWTLRFQDLLAFIQEHGHAAVPSHYPPNLTLSHWVKRQRAAFKSGRLLGHRKAMLDQVHFVWDVQSRMWDFRFQQLVDYQNIHGHCRVPATSGCRKVRELGIWVKCQRRQYKLWKLGKGNHLTPNRMRRLERLGFSWAPSTEKLIKYE